MTVSATFAPNSATDKPPRRPRRILVSLRIFMACLVLFGVISGLWFGVSTYRQHRAIQEVRRSGGQVYSEDECNWDSLAWLQRWISMDKWPECMKTIIAVDLVGSRRDDLRCLDEFPQIEMLALDRSLLRDDDLRLLPSLTRLRRVDLNAACASDIGLNSLSRFPNLALVKVVPAQFRENVPSRWDETVRPTNGLKFQVRDIDISGGGW